ncbi:MAG: nuclear transport factor 2 family protein [Acidimicrobiales bacterium]
MDPISMLVHTYADAVCTRNADQWGSTWTADAEWDMGQVKLSGRDEMVATWTKIMSGFPAVVHVVHNGGATLDEAAGTGSGRWYTSEFLRMADGTTRTMWGFYDDEYRNVDGDWKFAKRTLTSLYSGPTDMSGDFTPPS